MTLTRFFFSFFYRISSQQLIKQLQYENDALQSKIISIEQTELQEVQRFFMLVKEGQRKQTKFFIIYFIFSANF